MFNFIRKPKEQNISQADFLQSMQKLEVKDGDIIVLSVRGVLSEKGRTVLKDVLHEAFIKFGFNVHVLVFEESATIGILRKEV